MLRSVADEMGRTVVSVAASDPMSPGMLLRRLMQDPSTFIYNGTTTTTGGGVTLTEGADGSGGVNVKEGDGDNLPNPVKRSSSSSSTKRGWP